MNPTPVKIAGFLDESAAIKMPHSLRRFKVILIFASILFLLVSSVVSFYGYVAYTIERPFVPPLMSNPLKAAGLTYQDVHFPTADGSETINGWLIPAASKVTVILSHGYGTNREEPWVPMYDLARELHRNQYNVIMFDYGYAHNEAVTGGIREKQELLGAVEFARKQKGVSQVYIWGFSMGAGTALQAGLQNNQINGMILDSTFLLNPDTVYFNLKQKLTMLPRRLSIFMVNLMSPLFNSGYNLKAVPYRTVQSTVYPMPLFLIHGEKDDKAPFQTITSFFQEQKANPDTKLWLLPNGHHELIYSENRQEYINRTMQFLADTVNSYGSKGQRIHNI